MPDGLFWITGMDLLPDLKTAFMNDRNRHRNNNAMQNDLTGKAHGKQGIDKAPGEETSQDTENVIAQTQRGKNKVDGDPSKQSDQPIDRDRV